MEYKNVYTTVQPIQMQNYTFTSTEWYWEHTAIHPTYKNSSPASEYEVTSSQGTKTSEKLEK